MNDTSTSKMFFSWSHPHTYLDYVYAISCVFNIYQAYVWCTIYTYIIKWFSRSIRMMYTFFTIDVDGDNSDHLWGAAWGFAALQRTLPWLGTNAGRRDFFWDGLGVGKISENAGEDARFKSYQGDRVHAFFFLFFSRKSPESGLFCLRGCRATWLRLNQHLQVLAKWSTIKLWARLGWCSRKWLLSESLQPGQQTENVEIPSNNLTPHLQQEIHVSSPECCASASF